MPEAHKIEFLRRARFKSSPRRGERGHGEGGHAPLRFGRPALQRRAPLKLGLHVLEDLLQLLGRDICGTHAQT